MTTFSIVQTAAVAAGTAYNLPSWAPPLAAIKAVTIMPLGNGTAASDVAPIEETGVLGAPSAGQVSLTSISSLTSGDNIPADSAIIIMADAVGEVPSPASN